MKIIRSGGKINLQPEFEYAPQDGKHQHRKYDGGITDQLSLDSLFSVRANRFFILFGCSRIKPIFTHISSPMKRARRYRTPCYTAEHRLEISSSDPPLKLISKNAQISCSGNLRDFSPIFTTRRNRDSGCRGSGAH